MVSLPLHLISSSTVLLELELQLEEVLQHIHALFVMHGLFVPVLDGLSLLLKVLDLDFIFRELFS